MLYELAFQILELLFLKHYVINKHKKVTYYGSPSKRILTADAGKQNNKKIDSSSYHAPAISLAMSIRRNRKDEEESGLLKCCNLNIMPTHMQKLISARSEPY